MGSGAYMVLQLNTVKLDEDPSKEAYDRKYFGTEGVTIKKI